MASNGHQRLSNLGSSHDDSHSEVFLLLKNQIKKLQDLIDVYNGKMVDDSLCSEDLDVMSSELQKLRALDKKATSEDFKSNFPIYKTMFLKVIQESYRICDWIIDKQYSKMDNTFEISEFVTKILDACAGKENPLEHINYLFRGVFKNSNSFDLNFFGNIQSTDNGDTSVLTQNKREYKKMQKRPLEELVVPEEAENGVGDNELQMALTRVHRCLKEAVLKNQGKPISFYKFAIDPFSLAYSVENLFNLSSLAKDGVIKIERDSGDDHFTTVTVVKKKNKDSAKGNIHASFFTINKDLWKFYIEKYKITERMIEQNE